MSDHNKQLARRWVNEMCGQHALEVADEIFAPDMVDHNPIEGQAAGAEGQKQVLRELWVGFPDFHTQVEDLIAEGDRVVLRWSGRAHIRVRLLVLLRPGALLAIAESTSCALRTA